MNALQRGSFEQEMAISAAFTRKRVEIFGDQEVIISKKDERYQAIEAYMKKITQDWPKAPQSKCRFVNSYCTVFPRLVCTIVPGEGGASLFVNEIVKKAYFGPLSSRIVGTLTSEDATLTMQDIYLSTFAPACQGPLTDPDMVVINNKQPIRIARSFDPTVEKAYGSARVSFSGFLDNEDVLVEAERTKGSPNIKLIITICELRGKIRYDGSVTLTEKILSNGTAIALEKGPTFNIHNEMEIEERKRWVNMPFGLNVPFRGEG